MQYDKVNFKNLDANNVKSYRDLALACHLQSTPIKRRRKHSILPVCIGAEKGRRNRLWIRYSFNYVACTCAALQTDKQMLALVVAFLRTCACFKSH